MKLSARNILKGKVIKIVRGAVNDEITIQLPSGEQIVSIITDGIRFIFGTERRQGSLCCCQGFKRDDRG